MQTKYGSLSIFPPLNNEQAFKNHLARSDLR